MSKGILKESIYRERLYPDLRDWSVYRMHKHKQDFIHELDNIVLEYLQEKHRGELEELINKCVYKENVRIKNRPWKVDPPNDKLFWKKVKSELKLNTNASAEVKEKANSDLLLKIINRYSREIVGNFKIPTFQFARKFTTAFFGSVYNRAFYQGIPRYWWSRKRLLKKMKVYGEVDLCRSLFEKGTVVMVPTHSSNIDSIQIGFLLDYIIGLPHFSYGAGLNLYNSEIAAYFMNRLAAYRVDRRKKNQIYLETLKSMSQLAIQKGVNNLFFPGGTRSRSGKIESRLKKGLLSTIVDAQRHNFQEKSQEKVFIVPLVLSYHSVFEAPELIHQHLRRAGREKYISSRPKGRNLWQMVKLLYKLMTKSSELYAYLSHPIDVFGNHINENGDSVTESGDPVDIKQYFMSDGKLTHDPQRESIYTGLLADKIEESYYSDNIILSSQALAFYVFEYWREEHKQMEFYEFLRLKPKEFHVSVKRLKPGFEKFIDALRQMSSEGKFHLQPIFAEATDKIIANGLKHLGPYHIKSPLYKDRNNYLRTEDISTLYYYHNRLEGYDIAVCVAYK